MLALIQKCEKLLQTSPELTETEKNKWCDFLTHTAEALASLKDLPVLEEKLQKTILQDHLNRFDALSVENKTLLEGVFAFCPE